MILRSATNGPYPRCLRSGADDPPMA
jgi:hypothetical protein